METWLHVAEKPSVAREIVSILASRTRTNPLKSFSVYNPVVQFEYAFPAKSVSMIVTSVTGHLMEDEYEEEVKKSSWNSFPITELFTRPVVKSVRTDLKQTIQKNLEHYARKSKNLILWLDCDREGENIAFEVINVCTSTNSRIGCRRARFSGLSTRDVLHALSHLEDPNKSLSDAADARAEIDLRVGAAFTRFQTLLFRNHFLQTDGAASNGVEPNTQTPKLLSYGTCQFPTLGFVVKRFKEHESFVTEAHYKISLEYENCTFQWKRGVIYDKISTYALYFNCIQKASGSIHVDETSVEFEDFKALLPNVKAKVLKIDARAARKNRPYPLCTVEMQKLASKFLKLTSEKCMTLAESLYQEGYISYPRTETTLFKLPEGDLVQMVTNQHNCDDSRIREYAAELTRNDRGTDESPQAYFCMPRKGNRDDGAHPPIHPLKPFHKFPDSQKTQLLELVCTHFLAVCSDDAMGLETIITVEVGDEEFTCRGLMIKRMNWLQIFKFIKWSDRVVPNLTVGSFFSPSAIDVIEGKTSPPENLSEVELIELMDKHGIGTDATIATHIKTIQDREYVKSISGRDTDDDDDRILRQHTVSRFLPTNLGLALNHVYQKLELHETLFQPRVRADLEKNLSLIATSRKSKREVIRDALKQYQDVFLHMMRNQSVFVDALSSFFQRSGNPFPIKALDASHILQSLPIRNCMRCPNGTLFLGHSSRDNTNSIRCDSCKYFVSLPPWKIEIKEGDEPYLWCNRCHPRSRKASIDFCANGLTCPPIGLDQYETLCFWCSPEMAPYTSYQHHSKRPGTDGDSSSMRSDYSAERPSRGDRPIVRNASIHH